MAAICANNQTNLSPGEEKQTVKGRREMTPLFIDREQARKREVRVNQALFILKSTNFTWSRSPVGVLQDRLQTLGLDWTVFEEDRILFCTHKQKLSGKFRGNLRRYGLLLSLIKQRHWRWQIEMMWEVLFNRPVQGDSYSLTKILINLP